MPKDRQDEKQAEQTDAVGYEPKSDEKQPEDYSAETNPRRRFLKTAALTGIVSIAGILFGKRAAAEGLEQLAETAENNGLTKVTADYETHYDDDSKCRPDKVCDPYCKPCDPSICNPCYPNCGPNCKPKDPKPRCSPMPRCDPCVPPMY